MKKLFKKISDVINSAAISVKIKLDRAVASFVEFNHNALGNNAGEGYIDTAVKVLIAVVLGALVLAGLYSILKDTVMPTVTQKINDMFSYSG